MEEKLWKACGDGKVEGVRKLLQNSPINMNWQDPKYLMTPFCNACYEGHTEIVKLLSNEKRVDINKVQNDGATPFLIACQQGHIEIVKLLLNDNRVDINNGNKNDGSPFYIACQQGHIEIVKLLLNDKRVDINKATNDNATPFYIACQNGEIEILKYLLACGREIDINKKFNNTKTPLDISKERSTSLRQFDWETDEQYQKVRRNFPRIVELIESFQRNPVDRREKLRKELGLPDQEEEKRKLEEERKKIEEEEKRKEEEEKRKKEESKKSTYEIEYNDEIFKLKTTAKTLPELRNSIKTKIEIDESTNIRLYFKDNGKYIVLNDMEDLEDGTIIKVSTVSAQPQQNVITHDISNLKISSSNPSVFLTHTWVKDELNRDNHARVGTVNKLLKAQGFKTWFDEDKMVGHIYQKMAEGIDDSDIILVFITKVYMEKLTKENDNCKDEFTYSVSQKKKMIPIVMEPCMRDQTKWISLLGFKLGAHLYVDMSENDSENNIIALIESLKRTWSQQK